MSTPLSLASSTGDLEKRPKEARGNRHFPEA
jgi:hypothetical protein